MIGLDARYGIRDMNIDLDTARIESGSRAQRTITEWVQGEDGGLDIAP